MTTEIEFNIMKNEALGKLKDNKRRFNVDEIEDILNIIKNYTFLGKVKDEKEFSEVLGRILKDVNVYPKYEALGM